MQRWLLFSFVAAHEEHEALSFFRENHDDPELSQLRLHVKGLAELGEKKPVDCYRKDWPLPLSDYEGFRVQRRFAGLYRQNRDYLEHVLRLIPVSVTSSPAVNLTQIDALLWSGNYEEATATVCQALNHAEVTPVYRSITLTLLAQIRVQQQDRYETVAPLRRALELWCNNRVAYILLVRAYSEIKQHLRVLRLILWRFNAIGANKVNMPP